MTKDTVILDKTQLKSISVKNGKGNKKYSHNAICSANASCFSSLASPFMNQSLSHDTSISCTTFNILAPIYKRIGGIEGCRESQFHELWLNRNQSILGLLLYNPSSIICLQEFWLGNEELVRLYEDHFISAGYNTFKLARTNNRGDGLLTAFKKDQLRVRNYRKLLFCDCGDRVAQIFHLQVETPCQAFCEQLQSGDLEFLLVNTHLLFPHDSSCCLVRLRQVYKIIECLEQFVSDHGLASIPIVLCGDWNGSKRGHVYKFLRSQGFVSSYDTVHRYTDTDAHRWVSHRNHRGNICGVDFIWLRNPGKQKKSLSASWKEAVVGLIKAKLQEVGKDTLYLFQNGARLTAHEFQASLKQLGVTALCPEGLTREDLDDILLILYIEAGGLADQTTCIERMLSVEHDISDHDPMASNTQILKEHKKLTIHTSNIVVPNSVHVRHTSHNKEGFNIEDAYLFPPEVEQGLWPENYSLSDHAPLTAIFKTLS